MASHGGLRGRAGAQVRVPALRDPGRAEGRRRGSITKCHPPVPALSRRRRRRRHQARRCTSPAAGGGRDRARRPPRGWRHRPDAPSGRRRFAYPPNLLVVDGGPPQVAAAAEALAELGVIDVAVSGLAKRLEEVWLPGEADPVILPRTSEGLYLLQRVRDEAHRFAITYHRQKRSKRMTAPRWTRCPASGRPGATRCSSTSARCAGCGRPAPRRSPRCPASAHRGPRRPAQCVRHAARRQCRRPKPAPDQTVRPDDGRRWRVPERTQQRASDASEPSRWR